MVNICEGKMWGRREALGCASVSASALEESAD